MEDNQISGQLTKQTQNTLVKKGGSSLVTQFEQIVDFSKIGMNTDFDMNDLTQMAGKEQMKASVTDRKKRLLLLVNFQKDFFKQGLFDVPDVKDNVANVLHFIYNNMGKISRIITSLDIHIAQQIYHPCWWINKDGKHPQPYTTITAKDVSKRIWIPLIGSHRDNLQYLKEMEENGNALCIWPYYCISGTEGSCLEGQIAKMVYFHSVVRNSINNVIWNGLDFYTQAFGCINTEYKIQNALNPQILMAVENHSEVFIAGEMANHGLLEVVNMIASYYCNYPNITNKITVLTDCTSPMNGYEEKTKEEFRQLKKVYGIKFKNSSEVRL